MLTNLNFDANELVDLDLYWIRKAFDRQVNQQVRVLQRHHDIFGYFPLHHVLRYYSRPLNSVSNRMELHWIYSSYNLNEHLSNYCRNSQKNIPTLLILL